MSDQPQRVPLRTEWLDITPDLAKEWLRCNFRNRPVRWDTVRAYARDMLNKKWRKTHQGFAFNDRHELIDGQHRLHAIMAAGVTIRSMVTFGLVAKIAGDEMTTMDCVDRGATRSVADQLKIQHRMSNGTVLSFITAAIASLCCGERTRRLSVGQTLDVYRAFQFPIDWVIAHKPKEKGLKTAGVLAGFVFALATDKSFDPAKGHSPIARLFVALTTGETLLEHSPIRRLREFLTSDESKLFTPTLNRGLAELTLNAIHMALEGKDAKQLVATLGGADHFRTVQAERVKKIAALFKLPGQEKGGKA